MMKKKIKDLTLEEIRNTCIKHPNCRKKPCPLYSYETKECKHHSYRFWEEEVEVDESDNVNK